MVLITEWFSKKKTLFINLILYLIVKTKTNNIINEPKNSIQWISFLNWMDWNCGIWVPHEC